MKRNLFSLVVLVSMLLALVSSASATSLPASRAESQSNQQPAESVVARVYFNDTDDLTQLASYLDIWEVNHEANYLVAMLSPERYASLIRSGYRLVIDQDKTASLDKLNVQLPGQGPDNFPGYPCYRTVEEDYASMQDIAITYSNIAELIDIGNSWDMITFGGSVGYDIFALRLTNESIVPIEDKPTFFLMAEIHAREYVTAETALRYAEYLVSNYGTNPDITWLLDYFRVYIVTMTNPDGRKFAETGEYWRKNTDNLAGGGCSYPDYGIDLNRNYDYHWGGAGTYPCEETYQGPSAASEPETQAIKDFVLTLFPDQRDSGDFATAPITTTGTLITLHSYSNLVLWPWGWTYGSAPNNTQLQTLGRHLAYFNSYYPEQSSDLYTTTGSTDDWSYGELGIASYTFEMGTNFFQSCSTFESTIYPNNLNALLYAVKTARRPYMNPAGPDTLSVVVSPTSVPMGIPVQLTANANDTRFRNSNGNEPIQNIAAARYSIDDPSWITDTVTYPMSASDGSFNNQIENIQATINTSGLAEGRHTIFVESNDADGNWGVTSAVFLNITESLLPPEAEFTSNTPITFGELITFTNQTTGSEPITYTWDFGDGTGTSTEINPSYLYTSTGSYTVTLVAMNPVDTDSISHTVIVELPFINSVDLTQVTTNTIFAGDVVSFSADLSPDTGSIPYDYSIDFGDGNVITDTSSLEPLLFDHIFFAGGNHTVQIEAWNGMMPDAVLDSLDVFVNYKFFLPLTTK